MNYKIINKILALLTLILSVCVYFMTVQPSVSFWDCGEFAAASYYLQIPHPPGAPFFLLVGRIFMIIPIFENLGLRMNMVSVLSSGLTIMFLYLIIVKLILIWRKSSPTSLFHAISCYGGAFIGAMTFAFTDTFWFSAVESEVYAISMLFVSIPIWLILVWHEKADDIGNERILLLISFLIGLSIGVHLLSVLTILSFILIIYFRKFEITVKSFLIMIFVNLISFFIVYPGVVKYLPSTIAKLGEEDLVLKLILFASILVLLFVGMVWTKKRNYSYGFLGIASLFLILIGYTIYGIVLIRSNSNPPMNENQPDTMNKLVYYIGREQYGDFPIFQRRYSDEPHQQGIYTNYSSDMDFMWRYQIDHMYNRYLYWNFIGREGDVNDAKSVLFDNGNELYRIGTNAFPNKYWGIPFLFGLLGFLWHLRRDWKMGLSFLTMFLLMGVLTALYQNQQEPQPRERDYFYVGSFMVFAVWIGIAITGLMELLKEFIKKDTVRISLMSLVLGIGLFFGPINILIQNWDDHNRSNNYIPWDFAYNLLQSCEPDGLLIVNGDNDTFPVWYLQDVEGIRRDVRIINLSLANTKWYIKQLKDQEPYGAKKVPISLTDAEIDKLTTIEFEPVRISLPVSKEAIKKFGVTDTQVINNLSMNWDLKNTIQENNVKGIRVQDLALKNIIETNARNGWTRPIHYAITNAEDTKLNLFQNFIMQGMTYLLTPAKNPTKVDNIDVTKMQACLFNQPKEPSKDYKLGFLYRGLKDKNLYFDENQRKMMLNYRTPFFRLAEYQLDYLKDKAAAANTLDKMEQLIPRKNVFFDFRILFDVSKLYLSADRKDRYNELMSEVEAEAIRQIKINPKDVNGYYSPYALLLYIYEERKEYDKSLDVLAKIKVFFPDDKGLMEEIDRINELKKSSKQK